MEVVTERIEIIDTFTSKYLGSYATQKGKWINSILFFIYAILAAVFIGIVLWSIIGELTHFQSKFNWNKASVSVLFSISTLFNAFKGIYASILLKHSDFLKKSISINLHENSNTELAKLIAAHSKPMGTNTFITFLAIIILIGTVIHFFMDNQFIYYNFFMAPTLLFYVLTILDGTKTYKKLKANINKVEKSVHQSQPQLV